MKVFQTIFPEGAGYEHDKLELRDELSEEQKRNEPQNADSHLAFIGAGLRNCVTYRHRPGEPVYFVDLDGVNEGQARQRQTTIVGFSEEEEVVRERLVIPVSAHPIDSVNLKDPKLGLYEQIEALTAKYDVPKGRVRIELAKGERHAGLTVNEYETLLMRHDLAEVLREPLRFMREKASHLLARPRAIPNRSLDYAKYDMVQIFNQLFDHVPDERVDGRAPGGARAGGAGVALPADEALGQPARVRSRDRRRRAADPGHLPEPDPRAVGQGVGQAARGRSRPDPLQVAALSAAARPARLRRPGRRLPRTRRRVLSFGLVVPQHDLQLRLAARRRSTPAGVTSVCHR